MADMYGSIVSNAFRVKDSAAFRQWFNGYYFGEGITLHIDNDHYAYFAADQQYPCAYPRVMGEEGDTEDADLAAFARELCGHLMEGEIFNLVAGGKEKHNYAAFSQLVIAQAHPDKPCYRYASSDAETAELLELVRQRTPV